MILVVASQVDDVASRLVSEFPRGSAELLTCLDLSLPGWHVSCEAPSQSVCIAGGQKFNAESITGVICLLPCVFEQELVHIQPEDRAFVAAEMTAFLSFWLSSLSCPKLNPSTPGCLSGPGWRAERWLAAAASAGLPVSPLRRSTRPDSWLGDAAASSVNVTVVGRRCLGHDDPQLRFWARSLATQAGLDLLRVDFTDRNGGYYFSGASTFPTLTEPLATEAMLDYFNAQGRP